jgi:hypothetical protein
VTTVLLDLQIDLYGTVARGADPVTYLAGPMSGERGPKCGLHSISP